MIDHFVIKFVAGEDLNKRINESLIAREKSVNDIVGVVAKSEDELYVFFK